MTAMSPPAPESAPGAPTEAALQAAARTLGTGGAGATRLLALLYDPEVDVEPVLACLTREPALAARVLKVANSPFYRQSGHVGTLQRAVQVLGLTAIRGIAAAGCLDRLAPPRAGSAFEPERFRLHSLAVGCAAQRLSQTARLGMDNEAFMAGLLHDIGILLLAKAAPAALAHFVPLGPPESVGAADAATPAPTWDPQAALSHEAAQLGADHEACATLLVQAWQLPGWLALALAGHHSHRASDADTGLQALPGLLAVADHAAHAAGLGLWPLCGLPPPGSVLQGLGLSQEQLDAVVALLPEAVAALSPGA